MTLGDQSQHCFRLGQEFDLLRLHQTNPERYPHLLESVLHGTPQSRYDILFAFPGETINSDHQAFLPQLSQAWQQRIDVKQSGLPFHGGWFVYLGYELANEIEPVLELPLSASPLPTAFATRIPAALIRDHQNACCYLVCEPGSEALLPQINQDVVELATVADKLAKPQVLNVVEDRPDSFIDGVKKIRDYIHEGDVFQVNLSRAWKIELADTTTALQLYQSLRDNNPAPFAALVTVRGKAIMSSSPERLVDIVDGQASTRPIAGTRPRSVDLSADQAYSKALLAHPKERAEHVMLIDLERNDLGRVCQPGSVKVDELMVLESYAHVHHIVSNVSGRLRPEITPVDVIRAVFPGGTITGCPKVRCMQIIQELEQTSRGPYTGSVGYISHCGRMDLNILIRTMLLDGNQVSFRTGAGIVADSVAEAELQETRTKARGLLKALGINDVSA